MFGAEPVEKRKDVSKNEIVTWAEAGFAESGFEGRCSRFVVNEPQRSLEPKNAPDPEFFPEESVDGRPLALAHSIFCVVEFESEEVAFRISHQRYNQAYFPSETTDQLGTEITRAPEFKRRDYSSALDRVAKPRIAETITIRDGGILRTYAKYTNGEVRLHKASVLGGTNNSSESNNDAVISASQFDSISREVMKVVYSGKSQ